MQRQELRLVLLSIEQFYRLHINSFDKLQAVLLNEEYRQELDNNSKYQAQYHAIYHKCVNKQAKQIVQRSRHLFVAITREQFLNTSSQSKGAYAAFTDNFNHLSMEVKFSILTQENIAQSILAFERWVAVMQRCLALYDYNSAVAIFAALNFSGLSKYRDYVSATVIEQLDYMENLTQTANQSENLRDVMMGRCIPLLSIYKGILIHAKEGSSGNYALDEHELVIGILNSLADMQRQNRQRLTRKPPKMQHSQTIYKDCLQTLDRLKNYSNQAAIEEIRKSIAVAKTPEDQEKISDDILYHMSKFLREQGTRKEWQSVGQAQEVLKKMEHKLAKPMLENLMKYENCLNQIRLYSHAVNEHDSDEIKNIKHKLKDILKELRNMNSIANKINYLHQMIQQAEGTVPSPIQAINFIDAKPVLLRFLKRLHEILVEKEEAESYQVHIVTRKERDLIKKVFVRLNVNAYATFIERFPSNNSQPSSPRSSLSQKSSEELTKSQPKLNSPPPQPREKRCTSWHETIRDNEKVGRHIPCDPTKRGSLILTPDLHIFERAHDSQHRISSALVESHREGELKLKSSLRASQQKQIKPAAVAPKSKSTNQVNQATLFSSNHRDSSNKRRWSWPLVTANDKQYPDDENPEIITIKVKAGHYKKS